MANAQGIRAGRAYVELGTSDKLTKGLRDAQAKLQAFGASVTAAGVRLAAIGGAALVGFGAAIQQFITGGDALQKMSKRTGIAVESLSELGYAAGQSGSDLGTFEKGVRTLQRSINDAERGLSTAVDGFDELKLSATALRALSPEAQFLAVADAIDAIDDPSKRAALSMQLLGRAGTQLLPLMEGGAKGIEALRQDARALGLTISTETADAAAVLGDRLDDLKAVARVAAITIGAALAPAAEKAVKAITRAAVRALDWVKANGELIRTIAKMALIATVAGGTLIAVGVAVQIVAFALGGIATVIGLVTSTLATVAGGFAFLVTPIGAVVAVLGVGVAALLRYSGVGGKALEWLRERFATLAGVARAVIGGITDAMAAGDVALAARVLWAGVDVAWREGTIGIQTLWETAKAKILSASAQLASAMVGTLQGGLHAIEVAWIETTSFMADAWAVLAAGFKSVWETTQAFIAKGFLELQGVFDSGLDVKAAKDAIDKDSTERLAGIRGDRDASISAREERRNKQRKDAAEANESALRHIDSNLADALSKIDAESADRVGGAREALEKARAELEKVLEQASRARDEAEAKRAGASKDPFDIDDIAESLGSKIGQTIGTFNANALQSLLVGSSSAQDRTAAAAEQTAKNTKAIADIARSGGGLMFG